MHKSKYKRTHTPENSEKFSNSKNPKFKHIAHTNLRKKMHTYDSEPFVWRL